MKRYLLIILLLLPQLLLAQTTSVEHFFERYAAAGGFTSVQLEQKMMRMMSRQAAERGDRELASTLGGIRFIRIVALREGDPRTFVDEAEQAVAGGRFKLVASSTDKGQTTKFYLREGILSDNSELVMITYGAEETVFVDIYGSFDLHQVVRLSSMRPS